MQFQYRKIDENLIWNMDMINNIYPKNIDTLYEKVKNSFALKEYEHFSESFSKERLTLITNLMSYLSSGFRMLDSLLEKDNRKVSYLALLELLDYTIKQEDIQFRVKESCKYLRFKHKKIKPIPNVAYYYIDHLQYDVDGSGKLEEAMMLSHEEPYTCYSHNGLDNLYQKKIFNLVKAKVYPFYPYVLTLSHKEHDIDKKEIDKNKWVKNSNQYKFPLTSAISFFQAGRILQFETQENPVILDINFTNMEIN